MTTDPYQFPPGDVRPDDPAKPTAGPIGGEQGSNEHGESTLDVATVAASAQGGGISPTASGTLPDQDPELHGDVVQPTATAITPSTIHVGTVITVTGKGLGDVTAATVGGTAVVTSTLTATDTSVVLTVPAGVANGSKAVVLSSTRHGLITAPNITVS